MVDHEMSIPFKFPCPIDCDCPTPQKLKLWHHKFCKQPLRINAVGDIYCPNFKVNANCQPYFIKDAFFQCSESKSWKQINKASQFIMTQAQALYTGSFQLADEDLIKFNTSLNIALIKKWHD